jgi:predicted TPR repeat methyltransferase
VAADVFVYVGDLSAVFQGLRRALREAGIFAFSVEASAEQDLVLRPTRRYAHSRAYIERLAKEHELAVETIEPQIIRQQNGADVAGFLAVLRRS